jgi:3-methyladenine DNA glycosylase AlkD
MTTGEVMAELKRLGNPQQLKTYIRHGAKGDVYGVKIGDLKVVAKKLKGNQAVALELYRTGNLDAMYLAGLVVDPRQMTRKKLDAWCKSADWGIISEYTVAWVAAESHFARDVALKWIDSSKESVAVAGWNAYSGWLALTPDSELDLAEITRLLARVEKEIAKAPNRVRYCMNGFVISVGSYVKPLLAKAKATAKKIGKVDVEMGDTACKVPSAVETIQKIESMGRVGRRRKTVRC